MWISKYISLCVCVYVYMRMYVYTFSQKLTIIYEEWMKHLEYHDLSQM